jgi:hypothetical protein
MVQMQYSEHKPMSSLWNTGIKIKIYACAIIGIMLFAGCSSQNVEFDKNSADITQTQVGELPENLSVNDFKGPYAEELYAQVFNSENKPFLYQIYKDGVVTDEELAESRQIYSQCLINLGYEVEFDSNGSESTKAPKSVEDSSSQQLIDRTGCSNKSGYLPMTAIYADLKSNPNNEDIYKIRVACMIKHGLVPSDYTKDDFLNDDIDDDNSILGKILNDEKKNEEYIKCEQNPLDL